MKTKRGKQTIIAYIIRHTGRPVMASSRILRYDHKTQERMEVEEHIFDFMKKLILHIPEK